MLLAGFGPDLGPIVPKLFPTFGVNPFSETIFEGHTRRCLSFLPASQGRPGIWGRGRRRSLTPSPEAFIIIAGASLACLLLTERIQNKLHPTGYAKLFKDSEEVVSHRVLAHIELLGDLEVSHALGH